MTDLDLWEVRALHDGLSLELRGGDSRDGMRTKPAVRLDLWARSAGRDVSTGDRGNERRAKPHG